MAMPRTSRTGSPRGFTLIEVILAMTIAGVLMTCIFGVFTGVISAEKRVQAQNDRLQAARYLLSRLDTDLINAPAGDENAFNFSRTPTEPLAFRTRDEAGLVGSIEYVFKEGVLTRTWTPDAITAVVVTPTPAEGEPPALEGTRKMEVARGLESWSWKPAFTEGQTSGYPTGITVEFKWTAGPGVPPLKFKRLFRLEAQPVEAQK